MFDIVATIAVSLIALGITGLMVMFFSDTREELLRTLKDKDEN